MVTDRTVLNGLTPDMWRDEEKARLAAFLTDPEDKLLVARVHNAMLVMIPFCQTELALYVRVLGARVSHSDITLSRIDILHQK